MIAAPIAAAKRVLRITPAKAGVDRWPVKTGADPDAHRVNMTPVPATIAQLVRIPAPKTPPPARLAPTELTTYSVPCLITLWKVESDGDHHLVLTDETGRTMIAEIPDPQLVDPSSPWLAQIKACRDAFDAAPLLNRPVIVTGPALFDHAHGQTGVAPNAIEIHPVLSIVTQSS